MVRYCFCFLIVIFWAAYLPAQQQVAVISRCGGTETVTIPTIIDADLDGMDDRLEQRLLDRFMPLIIQFSNENCPGPALDGTGDSNLIACHIYPVPQQYVWSTNYDSIKVHPVALVPVRGLVPGMVWYYPLIKVNCAVLYGQDCGLLGHTADVEGFSFSIKYHGPDTLAGWMYDTVLSHWTGDTIQTISHAGTLCQQVEVRAYKSLYFPWGADSVYASPDKHGNYLTISGCGSSIICNPGCGSAQVVRHVRNINLGEPNATLVTDMGNVYPAYAGNDPWSTANFLNSQGGNAGAIRDKMIMSLSSTFIHGHTLAAGDICPLYTYCFGPFAHSYSDESCSGVPYQFHSRSLTQSGVYTDTVSTHEGCDSVVTLSLSVLPIDTYSYQAAVCSGSSYIFGGQPLTISGSYSAVLTDMHGCDSMVRLGLLVRDPDLYTYSAVSCDTSYTFGSQKLSASGTYIATLTDAHGCDSVVTLMLTVDSLSAPTWSGGSYDTVLAHSHAIVLTGTHPSGGVYTGAGVSGNIFFVDSVIPGSYPITYTYTDTQGCSRSVIRTISVISTGIGDQEQDVAIDIYPNPSSDVLYAKSAFFAGRDMEVYVYDLTGRVAGVGYEKHANIISINTAQLANGVYAISFVSSGVQVIRRFVKTER